MAVSLVWITPDADKLIGWMARVSNPNAAIDDPTERLIQYLIDHKHWSPFEMASACVEIETTRDIGRQILRHRSFHFQEFSQRYSEAMDDPILSEARLQDTKNRQNSLPCEDGKINKEWLFAQDTIWNLCWGVYQSALKMGIAKELARKLLPEGLTRTKMYMAGTMRDWLHYLAIRTEKGTQLEHRILAKEILVQLTNSCPELFRAAEQAGIIESSS